MKSISTHNINFTGNWLNGKHIGKRLWTAKTFAVEAESLNYQGSPLKYTFMLKEYKCLVQ